MSLVITPIACLKDNYAYLIRDGSDAWVVDPSEAAPVRAALGGLTLRGILATHHHHDHVGGIQELAKGDTWVAAHGSDRGRVPGQTVFVEAPVGRFVASGLLVGGRPVLAMHIPGHTLGAVAWGVAEDGEGVPTDVFTGDTLFAAGCGRLFEGTPAQMFTSLQSLTALPEATRLWFGHEYTANNLRFAAAAEPENPAVRERQARLSPLTTPTTVALERATNPFVRAGSVEELAARRAAKDRF
jgi:hydroxyacylglutathione hydrolase